MTAAVFACLWVVAAALVAMLPMRWQILPGLALLAAAAPLLWRLGADYGPWAAALAVLALLSMFRRPLRHLLTRARRRQPESPS